MEIGVNISASQFGKDYFKGYFEDMKLMKYDPTFTDATLICQGQEIRVHRAQLSARSDVFKRMFSEESGFVEGESKTIDVRGMDVQTLEQLLNFIYLNTIDDDQVDNVANLYSASDEYNIPELQDRCEAIMSRNLSVGNAATFFRLAYLHGALPLKYVSLLFITNHLSEVKKTQGWQELRKIPDAVDEILDSIIKTHCRK